MCIIVHRDNSRDGQDTESLTFYRDTREALLKAINILSATAVLVIKDGQVELLPIKKSGGLDRLIDMVPGIVEKVKDQKCCD